MGDTDWPELRGVCLDCRTALVAGEPCDGGPKHRVVDVTKANDRQRLVNVVWSPSRRKAAKQAATAGAAGGSAGGAAECGALECGDAATGCEGCGEMAAIEGEAAAVLAAVVVAAIAIVILYFIIRAIVRWVRKRRNRIKPTGADRRADWWSGSRRTGSAGVVADGATAPAPVRDGPACVAFGAALRRKRVFGKGDIMLLCGSTIGFEIERDDGARIRVPPGRVSFDMRGADWRSADEQDVAALLDTIDPVRSGEDFPPFPFDKLQLRAIAPGDRVEIVADLEPMPDQEVEHGGGYRDAAASILVPKGAVKLRLG